MINGNHRWLLILGAVLLLAVVGLGARAQDAGVSGTSNVTAPAPQPKESGSPEAVEPEPAQPTAEVEEPKALLVLPSQAVIQWETLKFSAEGFQPGEEVVLQVDQEGEAKEIGRVAADGDGKIKDGEVLLPSWLESGARTVQAVGESSGAKASETMRVRAKNLWVNLSGYNPQPATKLGFIAGGFEPGDQIRAYLTESADPSHLASQQPLATVTADESGNTSWTEMEIPVVQPGKYNLLLKGENTQEDLKTAITVEPLQPQLELSPWSGLPGRSFDVNAQGFLPGEQVDVFLGTSNEPVGSYQADQYGGVWGAGPISIPVQSRGGGVPVRLQGKSSGATITAEFSVVAANPWLELSNYSGFAGSPVMAHGGGFASGERVTLHMGGATGPVVGETFADEEGAYRGLGPVATPSDAQREVTFVVVGESSGTSAQATFKVVEPFREELPEQPFRQQPQSQPPARPVTP